MNWPWPASPIGPRNAFQVYLLLLAFVTGLPNVFGVVTAGSIEALLPPLYVSAWGLMLVLGSGATLSGMFWLGNPVTGLVVKRAGLLSLCIASLFYGIAILAVLGVRALLVSAIVVFFGVACWIEMHRVSMYVRHLFYLQQQNRDM